MNMKTNALINGIRQTIDKAGGHISFARFMELALYHPERGYYNADDFTLGKQGDFTTAPEVSPLFAQCLATQFLQINNHLNANSFLELGAGTGRFALDLLLTLETLDYLPAHYYIYEMNARLRQKQQALLKNQCPHLFSRCVWLDQLPKNFVGVIFANEVLDALPVHCFRIDRDNIKERSVTWQQDQLTWQITSPSLELAREVEPLRDLYALRAGYESEVNLQLPAFIQTVANALTQGVILFADYGYGQREYYHPERSHGTLTCFYRHTRHNNPFVHVGSQDMTAHVDFTRVIESAIENDCKLMGYTSQAAFLLACGLMDFAREAEKNLNPTDQFHLHQGIKMLTLPTEMGERIKVMALGKNIELPLLGFSLQDRRRDL